MPDHSSQRMLLLAKQGNRTALGELLQYLRPYLKVIARGAHRGGLTNRFDDSDLVQDAIVEVTRSFHRFRGSLVPEFLAWLRQVVSNTVQKSVRQELGTQKRNSGACIAEPQLEQLVDKHELPEQRVIVREETARLAEAIDRLPDEMKQVILMRLVDDLPHATIAAHLDRSEQAVRMLFVRSLRRLRELFGE